MSMLTKIHRAEVVGSLVRPPELIEARQALRAGQFPPDEYRAVEDRAVDDALKLQEEIGLDVVTDGEMRRDIFFDLFVRGLTGLEMKPSGTVRFHGHDEADAMEIEIPFSVTEKITPLPCPALDEFAYAKSRTSKPLKVTVPSSVLILAFWGDASRDAYPDPLELVADVGAIIKGWVRELADAGCEYIQLDAPELIELYCDESVRADFRSRGIDDPVAVLELGTQLAIELGELDLPNTTLGMHLCRGNGTQAWIAEGGYDGFAEDVFTRASGYDVFHLEYDDRERQGGFEPLAQLPDDKVAVLGLVSTKWTKLEDPEELKAQIREAAQSSTAPQRVGDRATGDVLAADGRHLLPAVLDHRGVVVGHHTRAVDGLQRLGLAAHPLRVSVGDDLQHRLGAVLLDPPDLSLTATPEVLQLIDVAESLPHAVFADGHGLRISRGTPSAARPCAFRQPLPQDDRGTLKRPEKAHGSV
jgi:5-methyltetrahydropteroyltriglutamate--homocysteine methyltransferase